jgi:hypothetical protein
MTSSTTLDAPDGSTCKASRVSCPCLGDGARRGAVENATAAIDVATTIAMATGTSHLLVTRLTVANGAGTHAEDADEFVAAFNCHCSNCRATTGRRS